MAAPHPVYRSLVRLYPREFRTHYGEDLVAHHADLVADRGARAAYMRTGLDLTITVPRYHLENLMSENRSATVLSLIIGLFAVGGLASFLTGVGPGLLLFAIAILLAVAQWSTLSRALRVPNSNLRRRRLKTGAILGAIFVASYVIYINVIGDSWTVRETVLVAIGTPAMFGSVGFLLAGLLTPRSAEHGNNPAPTGPPAV